MTTRSSPACVGPLATLAVCLLAALTGCHAIDLYTPSLQAPAGPGSDLPRELSMVSLPTYRIEPPDVIQIEVLKLVPRSPYHIETYDVLQISVLGTIIDEPIDGYYLVEGEGIVSLGPAYGTVRVAGMTIDEATAEIVWHLRTVLRRPSVSIQLARSGGTQQIAGIYRVGPDGTINLGQYGMVYVAGKTVTETRQAMEQHIARYFDSPQVAVDVVGYNSKSYYVIIGGKGIFGGRIPQSGETETSETRQCHRCSQVVPIESHIGQTCPHCGVTWSSQSDLTSVNMLVQRRPFSIRGNETVLDAISEIGEIQGLPPMPSKTIWVARPAPDSMACEEVLPVNWVAISRGGVTDTNYQILPGDRIYIMDDNLVATDNYISKFTSPIERLLSISELGANTVNYMQILGRQFNRTRFGL